MQSTEVIKQLSLEPHPLEGGYFRRSYQSKQSLEIDGRERYLMSSIYYLLCDASPIGYLHRNKSDIMHYHHQGSAIRYLLINDVGELSEVSLGSRLECGERPQLFVKGGTWKAAILQDGGFGLLSEAVCPGFDYEDNELATPELLENLPAAIASKLKGLIKTDSGQIA